LPLRGKLKLYGLNYFGPVGERNNFSHKEIILAINEVKMSHKRSYKEAAKAFPEII
jgi:hypothetical protein